MRPLLAIALVVATLGVDSIGNSRMLSPISDEFVRSNPFACLVFALLGMGLLVLTVELRQEGLRLLSWWVAALLPSLGVIAATDPREALHLAAFGWLLVGGVSWMVAYAIHAEMRALAVAVGLVATGAGVVGFCLYIASAVVSIASVSPLGLFQRVFLILFSVVLAFAASKHSRTSRSC